jgi:iron complex outermembrane recepter protein
VKVDNQANGKRVHLSMRGQGILSERGIRGINVLLDGLPLNDPTGFAADFYDVDWPTVDQVLVQRGPAASLYGGGSSAGVISVLTADGGLQPYSLDLSTSYGSNNFQRATGQVGGTLGGVNYRTSYTHNTGDGYRAHTAFRGDNFFAKAHWSPTAAVRLTPLFWYTGFFNENAEGLNLGWLAADRRQANPDALTYNEYMDTRRLMGGVTGEADLGGNQRLSFNGFVRHTAYRESVPSQVLHRTITAPGGTLQFTIERQAGSLRHTISVGTDVQWQTNDGLSHPNLGAGAEGASVLSNQRFAQSGLGFFALDQIDLGNHWGAMLNVRYDRVDNQLTDLLRANGVDLSGDARFERATGRVGLTWSPKPTLNLYGNIGQGFLPPATEELDANPAQIGGFNTGLRPAVSWGGEVGARGAIGERVVYDVGGFVLLTNRDFDRYRVSSRPLETFYRNAASSRRFGMESYVHWMPAADVVLQAAYTWSNFKYTNSQSSYGDVRGNQLPNSPVHQLSADAQYTIGGALTLGVNTQMLSAWKVDPSNITSVAGYTLLNARAAYMLHLRGVDAELTLAARNMLGKQYIAFTEPDPDGNSYQPAAEREVFLGLRIRP